MKILKWNLCAILLTIPVQIFSQSLFEEAMSITQEQEAAQKTLELNGYIRSGIWEGKIPSENNAETKSAYGEAALKLRAEKKGFGKAYSEIRFRKGKEFDEDIEETDIREAYVSLYAGNLDITLGQQIVVWGRADGINPTNNITPRDQFVRSSDEDDRREGNFIARVYYNFSIFRLEGIFVPFYRANPLPPLPDLKDADVLNPSSDIKNSAGAIRLHIETASFEGSLSWFNGYKPGTGMVSDSGKIYQKPYRVNITGADFSTSIGTLFGLRGEVAYMRPVDDTDDEYIPSQDIHYILGADREIGNLSIIVQYIGRHVFSFREQKTPSTPDEAVLYRLERMNRLVSSQSDETSHMASCRIEYKMLQEALRLECNTVYNFTTEELMIRPMAEYDITDALTVTIGGEFYHGPDDSLYSMVDSYLSAGFIEAKLSF